MPTIVSGKNADSFRVSPKQALSMLKRENMTPAHHMGRAIWHLSTKPKSKYGRDLMKSSLPSRGRKGIPFQQA